MVLIYVLGDGFALTVREEIAAWMNSLISSLQSLNTTINTCNAPTNALITLNLVKFSVNL